MRVYATLFCLLSTLTPLLAQQQPAPQPKTDTTPAQVGKSDAIEDINSKPPEPLASPIPSGPDIDAILKAWTSWDGKTDTSAKPNENISSFGPKLCSPKECGPAFLQDLYVIHISISTLIDEPATSKISLKSSKWYLYKPVNGRKELRRVQAFNGKFPAIVGAKSGALISVSILYRPAYVSPGKPCDLEAAPAVAYEVTTKQKQAANEAAFISLLNIELGAKPTNLSLELENPESISCNASYVASASIYKLDPKTIHAPFDWSIVANVTGSAGSTGDCNNLTKAAKCTYTQIVSVDAPQYWNVGIDITPRGPRQNKYALSNSNIVTQTHTIHSPLYVSFDFSPWAQTGYRPYFQAGVPLSGAAFHIPFVAVAEPLPFTKKWLQISVYGGVVFMQQTFPRSLAIGQTSNTAAFNADLVTDRAIKPIFGIEVPITSIISKVKSSVGNGK